MAVWTLTPSFSNLGGTSRRRYQKSETEVPQPEDQTWTMRSGQIMMPPVFTVRPPQLVQRRICFSVLQNARVTEKAGDGLDVAAEVCPRVMLGRKLQHVSYGILLKLACPSRSDQVLSHLQ